MIGSEPGGRVFDPRRQLGTPPACGSVGNYLISLPGNRFEPVSCVVSGSRCSATLGAMLPLPFEEKFDAPETNDHCICRPCVCADALRRQLAQHRATRQPIGALVELAELPAGHRDVDWSGSSEARTPAEVLALGISTSDQRSIRKIDDAVAFFCQI